ncbi:hypothetical protein BRD03_07130 [Halobacteriales archaeon QS_9_68_17]|nr:MAG: hypothetical protein BRD03_07130 [Halobacteriales archaeon QS_9_68_17]
MTRTFDYRSQRRSNTPSRELAAVLVGLAGAVGGLGPIVAIETLRGNAVGGIVTVRSLTILAIGGAIFGVGFCRTAGDLPTGSD